MSMDAVKEILRCPKCGGKLEITSSPQGFICNSCEALFPVRDGILHFLQEDKENDKAETIKLSVQDWYDTYGWQKNDRGLYNDTADFSQLDDSPHAIYEVNSHLNVLDCFMGGKLLLDAGSGPITHPEYLAYSWFYEFRVCVDFSITALREARKKLGNHGIYVLADICNLPFEENVFDGVISGYAIQHIPHSYQKKAALELFRVLSPDRYLVILSDVRRIRPLKNIAFLLRLVLKLMNRFSSSSNLSRRTSFAKAKKAVKPPNPLYYCPRDFRWWKESLEELPGEVEIQCNRLLQKDEFEYYVGNQPALARHLGIFEETISKLLAPFSSSIKIKVKKNTKGHRDAYRCSRH